MKVILCFTSLTAIQLLQWELSPVEYHDHDIYADEFWESQTQDDNQTVDNKPRTMIFSYEENSSQH